MTEHYPRIRTHSDHGLLLLREALSFTFYISHPHAEVAQGVRRSLDAYLRGVEPDALGLYLDNEGYWWPLDAEAWETVGAQFLHPKRARVHLGDASREHRYRFEYVGRALGSSLDPYPRGVSTVSFWLSTEYLETHGPGRVRELAMELAALLPFCTGHVGLFFNCDLGLVGIRREVLKWCFRYPGLDIPELGGNSLSLGTRVRTIGWLTFLGQPVLGELGGAAGLRSRLQTADTRVQELEGDRAVVTLGPWPEAGDTEKGQLLPAYRELARVLEPWTHFTPSLASSHFNPEDLRRWERRFLD
jgi:hypothetical protein